MKLEKFYWLGLTLLALMVGRRQPVQWQPLFTR